LLSPEREFLIGAYRLILGREPDDDGMTHYLISLRGGKSRIEVLAILIKSREAKKVNQPSLEELRELIKQTGAGATGWRKWLAAPKIIQHQLRMLESQMALLAENLKIVADASQVQADNYCILADDSTQIGNLPFQEIQASTIETSDLHFSVEESHIAQSTVGSINLIDFDTNFEPNEKREVIVELKNCSNVVWRTCAEMPVHISYHWFFENGDVCTFDGKRTALSEPVAPGDSKKLRAFVLAPVNYGKYVLEVTLLCERQYWFEERGFQSCLHPVSIDSPKLCPRAEHIYNDLKTAIANRTR